MDRILFTNKKIEIQPVFQIQNESKKSSSDLDKETALVAEKFEFVNADLLKRYIVNKKMTVKKLIIGFSVHPKCKNNCIAGQTAEIGNNCPDTCAVRMKRTLSDDERKVILYSMIYLEKENQNLDPDVRTLLWLRASGANQYLDTFREYPIKDGGNEKWDYYTALSKSPIPPSPSISLIHADHKRLTFDCETVKKKYKMQRLLTFINNDAM